MGWLAAAAPFVKAGTSLLGGLLGGGGSGEQRRLLGEATGGLDWWARQTGQVKGDALNDVDAANMILAGIEPAVLQGFDESSRVRLAQQMLRDRQEADMMDQRLASAGLDSTTVAPGVQRGRSFQQAQNTANIAAQYAMGRGQAIASARGMQAQGMMNRANIHGQYLDRQLGLQQQKSNILAGTQIVDNTAANIGALGASISDSILNSELLGMLEGDGGFSQEDYARGQTGLNTAAGNLLGGTFGFNPF